MASIEVRVTGDKAAIAALRRGSRNLKQLAPPTRTAAREVAQTARRLAAKRTGRLAATMTTRVSGGVGVIGNRTRYAAYQEYGTRVMRAHPYLRPALYGTDIQSIYEDHAERAVRNI